jgi:hypothetical protein
MQALHCTALHCTAQPLPHASSTLPSLAKTTCKHCAALHCTALHCTALHNLRLILSYHYPGRPRLRASITLHCTALPPPHATSPLPWLALTTCKHCTALHCTALHCTPLHYLRLMLPHYYPGWPRLHASIALHCTALHCTTSASCFLNITLAGLYYMLALRCTSLHCIALPHLRLMLPHHYPGCPRPHASIALHCTTLHCTALHFTTSASYYLTITLAGLDYMQASDSTPLHCTALRYLRLMLLYHYPGWYTQHASTAMHCTALHCTAFHCTTSASCFFNNTLAGLDYMQALHCTALHCIALPHLRLMLPHYYPGCPRPHASTALHCTPLHYLRLILSHNYPGCRDQMEALHCTSPPPPHATS